MPGILAGYWFYLRSSGDCSSDRRKTSVKKWGGNMGDVTSYVDRAFGKDIFEKTLETEFEESFTEDFLGFRQEEIESMSKGQLLKRVIELERRDYVNGAMGDVLHFAVRDLFFNHFDYDGTDWDDAFKERILRNVYSCYLRS
ncbi:unknown protein [Desulfotalea psychrophila LSv54]|uniref:Uncharacterized protein n=2 Tax=Desulfotalea psychrophila TaxID=84980 RepID=Q6AMX1_DESPS|nr:unknown protein [Desulfotalea psychrophila LSv54]